jgi:hypothetical protein
MNPLMMETTSTSETSVNFYQTTRRNNPETGIFKSKVLPDIKHHTMKAYGVVEVKLHTFLTSGLHRSERSSSLSGHFTPVKEPLVSIV